MNTNDKGYIGLTKVIGDLANKGYQVFTPISEHCVVDLIGLKDNICYKFQIKYSTTGKVRNFTVNNRKNKQYNEGDFDYYAVFLPTLDKVIYLPYKYGGIDVRIELPDVNCDFWWFEDFSFIENKQITKRNTKEFKTVEKKDRIQLRKVERPSKEELEVLVWKTPATLICKEYGVSDKTIKDWCDDYKITKPPRGYWTKRTVVV